MKWLKVKQHRNYKSVWQIWSPCWGRVPEQVSRRYRFRWFGSRASAAQALRCAKKLIKDVKLREVISALERASSVGDKFQF